MRYASSLGISVFDHFGHVTRFAFTAWYLNATHRMITSSRLYGPGHFGATRRTLCALRCLKKFNLGVYSFVKELGFRFRENRKLPLIRCLGHQLPSLERENQAEVRCQLICPNITSKNGSIRLNDGADHWLKIRPSVCSRDAHHDLRSEPLA